MNYENLSLEVKCGQLIAVGFEGVVANDEIKSLIRDYHIGNIILFDRNFQSAKQLFDLIKDLQKVALEANGLPLFVAIDQEGGMVTRLHGDVTFFPGAMAVSSGASKDETYSLGRAMGNELFHLGINMNLAPCADVNNNPNNPVINVRSYGDDPNRVADYASAYARGMQEENIIATAKHFPGHGDTAVDSHLGLPLIPYESDRLNNIELLPFKHLIDDGIKAIMSAHIVFPCYEEDKIPATISKNILTGLLREKLNFQGLIVSDCMEMQAIQKTLGTVVAASKAILAGMDLLFVSHTREKQIGVYEDILSKVKNGEIPMDILNACMLRITKEKKEIMKHAIWEKSFDDVKGCIGNNEHRELASKISRNSITMVKEKDLPFVVTDKTLIVITAGKNPVTGVDSMRLKVDIEKELKTNFNAKVIGLPYNPSEKEINDCLQEANLYTEIVVLTCNAKAHLGQAKLVKGLYEINNKLAVIAMRSPYDIEEFNYINNYLLAYECTPLSTQSVIEFLKGKIKAMGKLIIKL